MSTKMLSAIGLLAVLSSFALAVPPGDPSFPPPLEKAPCVTHNGLASLDPSFAQVDTSLGPATALEDKRSHLRWLHLNLTAGRSHKQIKAELSQGRLVGWRYATPTELKEFFSHYDGAPNGYSTNPAFVARLQCDLGGPLFSVSNPQNGFQRTSSIGLLDVPFGLGHAQYGYIADDNFTGPVIDPSLQGSAQDVSAVGLIGSYLVQGNRPSRMHRFWSDMGKIF